MSSPQPPAPTAVGNAPLLNGSAVKLIASDIDGTILSYASSLTGELSPRTVEAFRAAREAGVAVVLVTGRPVRGLRGISRTLGLLGPVIASNGAVTYDLAEDAVVTKQALADEALFEAKGLLRELDSTATFAAETLAHLHMEESFARGSLWFDKERRRSAGISDDEVLFGPLDDTLQHRLPEPNGSTDGTVVKLLAKTHAMEADAFIAEAQERIGHLVTVTHSAPGVSLLEISAKGVNKAQALRCFAGELGVDAAQSVAFGDMPNDVEMLQWAGTSWAVGSAHPMARSAADHVTASCDEDGVAEIIEQLVAGELA
ncbi:HAD family phosphatase [Nesterenkonia sp. MY13]|uniref:HAD family phosphatase n=1 Tax=Nesterenkonia sedimenti TaxID=1463632 RepID=A0A7X8TLP6_9MICC|nr:Cof-type HAD-IIB family hydrolase [Nesterenkonia sedimenti]NLS10905.1 HAD family phosphatase [Nesterenkonia sedimenti]